MARKRSVSPTKAGPQATSGAQALALDANPAWLNAIRKNLVSWYQNHQRDLPWRADHDPYRILVSEMMLVQTTVAAVIPYFARFMARFPTVQDLASAPAADVLKAWEGLGYYRRARLLHAAAQAVVERHGGQFPRSRAELEALPGIGRYIAGAVASFAFDLPEAILEANTQRLLARLIAWPGELGKTPTQKRLWSVAEALVPDKQPGDFNQALMDLGATICLPRNPLCLLCPLAEQCEARQQGLQQTLPLKAARQAPLVSREVGVLAVRQNQLLLARRSPGQLWEEFWEIPTMHESGADPAGRVRLDGSEGDLIQAVRLATGLTITPGNALREFKYSVTRHAVTLQVVSGAVVKGVVEPGPGYAELRWVNLDDVVTFTLSAVNRQVLAWLQKDEAWRNLPPGEEPQARPKSRKKTSS